METTVSAKLSDITVNVEDISVNWALSFLISPPKAFSLNVTINTSYLLKYPNESRTTAKSNQQRLFCFTKLRLTDLGLLSVREEVQLNF